MDRYIVTVVLKEQDGSISITRWNEYGREGLVTAVKTVDWDVKKNGVAKGTIHRVLPEGGTIQVYARPIEEGR